MPDSGTDRVRVFFVGDLPAGLACEETMKLLSFLFVSIITLDIKIVYLLSAKPTNHL